jgi:hypothetical protein
MKHNSIQQNNVLTNTANIHQMNIPRISDDAFYVMTLASKLKKLLGQASLQHFLATGESVVFTRQAS